MVFDSRSNSHPSTRSHFVLVLQVIDVLKRATFRVTEISFEVDGWLPVSHVEVQHEGVKYVCELSPAREL